MPAVRAANSSPLFVEALILGVLAKELGVIEQLEPDFCLIAFQIAHLYAFYVNRDESAPFGAWPAVSTQGYEPF